MKQLLYFILITAIAALVSIETDTPITGVTLPPCGYEVFQWDFDLDNPLNSFVLISVDAMLGERTSASDFDVQIFIDYAEPTASSVGTGSAIASLDGQGGLSESVEIPRSCNLGGTNTLYISLLNHGERELTVNVSTTLLFISTDDFVEIIMENNQRTYSFTVSRFVRPDVFLDPYFFHKITFSDTFKQEISLVSTFTITITNANADAVANPIPVFVNFDHFPVQQDACGDITGTATDDPFQFQFSSCDIANIDAIYIALSINTDYIWRINILPDASDDIVTTSINPNDPNTKNLLRPATISGTQFFEVNTLGWDLSSRNMIVNVDNVGSAGYISLYQVTPSCRLTFYLCEQTSEGCKYVFTECELKRWRDLGLTTFTFGLETGDPQTAFTFSVEIVDVAIEEITIRENTVTEIADTVGYLEIKTYEISIEAAAEYLTCNHDFWLDIYVYVDSADDFVSIYLNNGKRSSLGDSACGDTYRFCSVLDNDANSIIRGCGFQLTPCELSEFGESNWFLTVQGKRPDGTPAEERFYQSTISYTVTASFHEPILLSSLPAIESGEIENTFYSRQYLVPASIIKEGRGLRFGVQAFREAAPGQPFSLHLNYGGHAGVTDGCLDSVSSTSFQDLTSQEIYGCWDLDDTYKDKDLYISITGQDSFPIVKEYYLSLDYIDIGSTIPISYNSKSQFSILEEQQLNFSLPSNPDNNKAIRIDFIPQPGTTDYEINVYATKHLGCIEQAGIYSSDTCQQYCSFYLDSCVDDLENVIITVTRITDGDNDMKSFSLIANAVTYQRSGTQISVGSETKFCSTSDIDFYEFEAPVGKNLVVKVYFDAEITGSNRRQWDVELYSPMNEGDICDGGDLSCSAVDQQCIFTLDACELDSVSGKYILSVRFRYSGVIMGNTERCYTIELIETSSFESTPLQLREGRYGELFGTEGIRYAFQYDDLPINDPNFRPVTRISIDLGQSGSGWVLQPFVFTKPVDQDNVDYCSCDEVIRRSSDVPSTPSSYFCDTNPCVTEFHWCEMEEHFGRINIFLQPEENNVNRIPYSILVDDFQNGRYQALTVDGNAYPIEVSSLGYVYFLNPQLTGVVVLNFDLYDTSITIRTNQHGPATSACFGGEVFTCDANDVVPPAPFFRCRVVVRNCEGVSWEWLSVEVTYYTRRSQIRLTASTEVGVERVDVDDVVTGTAIKDQKLYYEIDLDSTKFYMVTITSVESSVTGYFRSGVFCEDSVAIVTSVTVPIVTDYSSLFWILPCDLTTGTNTYTFEILSTADIDPLVGTAFTFDFTEHSYPVISLTNGVPTLFNFNSYLVDPDLYFQVYKFEVDRNTDSQWTNFLFTISPGVSIYRFHTETDIGLDALSSTTCAVAELGSTSFSSTPCCNEGGVYYFIVGESDIFIPISTLVVSNTEITFAEAGSSSVSDLDLSNVLRNYHFRYLPTDRNQYLSLVMSSTIVAPEIITTFLNFGSPSGNAGCFDSAPALSLENLAESKTWMVFPCENSVDIYLGYRSSVQSPASTFDDIEYQVVPYNELIFGTRTEYSAPSRKYEVFYYDLEAPDYRLFSILDYLSVDSEVEQVGIPLTVYLSYDQLTQILPNVRTNILPDCAVFDATNLGGHPITNTPITDTAPVCNSEGRRFYFSVQGHDTQNLNFFVTATINQIPHTVLAEGDNYFDGATDDYYVVDTSSIGTSLSYIVLHVYNVTGNMNLVRFELFVGCDLQQSCSDGECIFIIPPCNLVPKERNYFVLQYITNGSPLASFTIKYEIKEITIIDLLPGEVVGELITDDYIQIYRYQINEPQSVISISVEDWFDCNSGSISTIVSRGQYSTCREEDSPNHLTYCNSGSCNYITDCEIVSDDIYVTLIVGQTRVDPYLSNPVKYRLIADSFIDSSITKTIGQGETVEITLSDIRSFFRIDLGRSFTIGGYLIQVEINPDVVSFSRVIWNQVSNSRCDVVSQESSDLSPNQPKASFSGISLSCYADRQQVVYFETLTLLSSVIRSNTDLVVGKITAMQAVPTVIVFENDYEDLDVAISYYPTSVPTIDHTDLSDLRVYRNFWPSHNLVKELLESGELIEVGNSKESDLRNLISMRRKEKVTFHVDSSTLNAEMTVIASVGGDPCLPLSSVQCSLDDENSDCEIYTYLSGILDSDIYGMYSAVLTDSAFADFDYVSTYESPAIDLEKIVCYEFSSEPTFFKLPSGIGNEQIYHFTAVPSAKLDQRMNDQGGSLNFELSADQLTFGGAPTFSLTGDVNGGQFEFTWRCAPTLHKLYDFFSMAVTVDSYPPFVTLDYEIVDTNPITITLDETIETASGYYKFSSGSSEYLIIHAEGDPGQEIYVSKNVVNHGCASDDSLRCTTPGVGRVCSILLTECNGLEDAVYYIHVNGIVSLTVIDSDSLNPIRASLDDVFSISGQLTNYDESLLEKVAVIEFPISGDQDSYREYEFHVTYDPLFGSLLSYYIYPEGDTCGIVSSQDLSLSDCSFQEGQIRVILIALSSDFCQIIPYSVSSTVSSIESTVLTSTITLDYQELEISLSSSQKVFTVSVPDNINELHGIEVYATTNDGTLLDVDQFCGNGLCGISSNLNYYYGLSIDQSVPNSGLIDATVLGRIFERTELVSTIDGSLGSRTFGLPLSNHYYYTHNFSANEILMFTVVVTSGESISVSMGDGCNNHFHMDCAQADEECIFEFREYANFFHVQSLAEHKIFIDISGINTEYKLSVLSGEEVCGTPSTGETDFCKNSPRITDLVYHRNFVAQDKYASTHHAELINIFKRCDNEQCVAEASDCFVTPECSDALAQYSCEAAFPICGTSDTLTHDTVFGISKETCEYVQEKCGKTFTDVTLYGFNCELSSYIPLASSSTLLYISLLVAMIVLIL